MEKLSNEKLELELPNITSTTSNQNKKPNRTKSLLVLLTLLSLIYVYYPNLTTVINKSNSLLHRTPHLSHHSLPNEVQTKPTWRERKAIRNYISYLESTTSHGHDHDHKKKKVSEKDIENSFLSAPTEDSARAASHSFTAKVHVAGTEGDKLSALLVKSQWESLLNLPITSPETNFFEAGTPESRKALTGRSTSPCTRGGRGRVSKEDKMERKAERFARRAKKWIGRTFGWNNRRWSSKSGKGWSALEESKPRVWIDTYYPLLNYPVSHSLKMTPIGSDTPSFVAKLLEDAVPEDLTSIEGRYQVPTFHGLSFNGTASGQLIYVGRGSQAEFQALKDKGIDFKGKIAIVQYGGSFRGLKVKAAADFGCVGALVYTDPIEDGEITAEKGYDVYPNGPARQPSSVQRGSTQFLSSYPGDPLTPFTPAYKNTTVRLPRDDPSINIPSIPSLPISYEDAIPLLKSLNGKGIKMGPTEEEKKRDSNFREGGLGYLGVEYWSGPGEEVVEMENIMKDEVTAIWNTMAVIPGYLSDEVVIVGNHNDAWTFGAGDPNSGTASVHEMVKGLGHLLSTGWKPLRTIILASWDAEEYGLIGSTEFGEDFSEWLKERTVAYLNVDVSVAGSNYGIGASPSLAELFKDVSEVVRDPDEKEVERSLLKKFMVDREEEEEGEGGASKELKVGPLGSGSDFTVFLQHLGIASANVGYSRKRTDPVYHYHSIYDSAYWMDKFGDPTFSRHVAVAKVMGLATLRLADSLILPINLIAYGRELKFYSTKIHTLSMKFDNSIQDSLGLKALDQSIKDLQLTIAGLSAEIASIEFYTKIYESMSKGKQKEKEIKLTMRKVRSINKRLREFEAGFIDVEGLPGREWYRSLVVAPGRYLGYGATTFPAITESLTLDNDFSEAAVQVTRLIKALEKMAEKIKKR